jgi:transaldolase
MFCTAPAGIVRRGLSLLSAKGKTMDALTFLRQDHKSVLGMLEVLEDAPSLEAIGIDVRDVFLTLENEGVEKFKGAWSKLLEATEQQLSYSSK